MIYVNIYLNSVTNFLNNCSITEINDALVNLLIYIYNNDTL